MGVGVGLVGLAQGISPSCGMEAAGSLLVGSTVGSLPGSPGLVGRDKFLPKLGVAVNVSAAKGGGGQDSQSLVNDGQTSPCCLALSILQQEDVLKDVQRTLAVLAHLDSEQYHV